MRREIDLTFTSKLSASVERVWAHAVSMDGVNFELSPWVRMSVPRERAQKTIADAPLEQEAFVSTLCALGVFPFDRHHLTVASMENGRSFSERSWSLLQRSWWHDRSLLGPSPDTCTLTDRLRVVPRVTASAGLVRTIVNRLFEHRHERLCRKFGQNR